MFDFSKLEEIALALCLTFPLPCFLISLRSKRWSAALLWLGFVALWWTRAHIRPNPEWNPVDTLGAIYLLPAATVQLAILFAPKKDVLVASE
jgi:hypothetical protein